ncbi:MAG: efflux RND transporter periplasmic adaptor subunit [Bryobacteraceae bacterium]
MKRTLFTLQLVLLAACSSQPETKVTTGNEHPERRTENTTLWSDKTELYLEYPVLVQGEESRFAIHLTRLGDFKPVPAGRSEVRLTYADGTSESFTTRAPSKAGIFGVTVKPSRASEATVEVILDSPNLGDKHRIKNIPIFKSLAEAPTGELPATEETLSFLKEQQWAMDFATSPAESGVMRESMVVPAEVSPRSGGQVDVTAPMAGRLIGEAFPVLGSRVTQGQVLASLIPPTSVPNDRASLDLAKAEADAALAYARKDHDRASRLVDAGAAPRKRLEETITAESIAEARLRAAEERIRQFDASRSAEGAASSSAIAIRAPIAGTIIQASASPGANLKGGEILFRILDTERVYVSAIVPEAEYPKARSLSGAEIEIPGDARPRPAGRLVSVGKVVDAASRTFPIVYEFPNGDGRIAINQTVTIRLFLGGSRRGVMIPETALVDDGGRFVVFLQRSGEKFVRKPVDVGYRQSGMAEITSGVEAGDRIVIQGAYLIRLSALSTQIPAHGHVH